MNLFITGSSTFCPGNILRGKGGRAQIFGNNLNKSKFHSGRNWEQTEVRK
jgi:hypothetical protein